MHIIYINDLFSINENIKDINFKINDTIEEINWFKLINKQTSYENLETVLINKINDYNQKTIIIIDSLSIFLLINSLWNLNIQKIEKIIIINPITKNFLSKLINIKRILHPQNLKQMLYSQMFFYHNFANFYNNEKLVEYTHITVDFIQENNFIINRLLNQMFTLKNIKKVIDFCKLPAIIKIIGEQNPFLSKKDIQNFKKTKINTFVINNCGYYLFNEQKDQIIHILNEAIYGK